MTLMGPIIGEIAQKCSFKKRKANARHIKFVRLKLLPPTKVIYLAL